MALVTIPKIHEREHNPQKLKDTLSKLVKLSESILKFSLERSSLEEIENIKNSLSQLISYGETLSIAPERMYKIHYDLYAKIFEQNKSHILKNPTPDNIDDFWIRKQVINLELGSNMGSPRGVVMPLSTIYNYSVEIYKKHYQDQKYNLECCYVDLFILYLYQIFSSFKWDTEDNKQLGKLENHINVNILKISNVKSSNTPTGQSITNILSRIPSLVEGLASTLGKNNDVMGEKLQEFSKGAKKIFNDPNVSNLIVDMFSGLSKDINGAKGDPNKMLESAFNRIGSENFSEKLQETVKKHVAKTNEVTDIMK